jgi:surface polysaccharide O-acyltransferase-like enzyme
VITERDKSISVGKFILNYLYKFFFSGSYATIWFLLALAVAVAIVYLLLKKLDEKTVFIISLFFYLIGAMASSYFGLTAKIPYVGNAFKAFFSVYPEKSGPFFGFAYVAMGALIANPKKKINPNPKKNLLFACVSYLLLLGEVGMQIVLKFNTDGVDILLALLPFTYFIFMFLKDIDLKDNKRYVFMRKMSTLVFLSQRLFLNLVPMGAKALGLNIIYTNLTLYFVVVLACTMLFSYLFMLISNKVKFLKMFY